MKVYLTLPGPGPPFPWTAQNFALFFHSPAAECVLFFPLSVFSLNFGGVLKAGTLKCARMEFSCEHPAASDDPEQCGTQCNIQKIGKFPQVGKSNNRTTSKLTGETKIHSSHSIGQVRDTMWV